MVGMIGLAGAVALTLLGISGWLARTLAIFGVGLLVSGWDGHRRARLARLGDRDILVREEGLELRERRLLIPWGSIESLRVRQYLLPWIAGTSVTVTHAHHGGSLMGRRRRAVIVHSRHYIGGDALAESIRAWLPAQVS